MAILLMLAFLMSPPAPDARSAVARALPILQRSAGEFVAKRACVSCHHNILPVLALDLARNRGFEIDTKVLDAVEEKTFRELRNPKAADDAIQATALNDPTPNDSMLLMAAHDAGLPASLATAVLAFRLARWQRDGHWITSDFRPPHSNSSFMATATAIRAITSYLPKDLRTERDRVLRSARQWLTDTQPASTEDAAFRIIGLVWSGASSGAIATAQHDLVITQKPNGGWSQLPWYDADAYSTGEALYALHEAGTPVTDAAFAKGVKFLISTQATDGTWHVRTRMLSPAEVSPKYFTTGFPYVKDEYISYAGSCWAVMALLTSLPESAKAAEPSADAVDDTPSWVRTAFFGTKNQIAALLNDGLDPNTVTKNGTTLLMASAADPEKVQLLLSRESDPLARAPSGADALTIAAAYRGTSESVRALLEAGVPADPPEGVRVRHAPIVLAAMSGDLENIKVLLKGGAKPREEAVAEAVTFGYPDIVRTLLAAGGSADIVESSGINLLHWATIANRPQIIPVLVEAHVPINDMDDHGFTPLMYAATIDHGDTAVLKALLNGGADKSIRNSEGRTPLEQARRYKLRHLETALR